MIQRLWSFVKRHKKKFIGTAFIFGGGYVTWRFAVPRIQEYFLKRLMKSLGDKDPEELLKDLMEAFENPEREEAKKREKFSHNQQVSDGHTEKALACLEGRLNACFEVELCSENVKNAESRDDKMRCLSELQIECFARSVAALYSLHLLLLQHRVVFNIVGRETVRGAAAPDARTDTEALESFIKSATHMQGDGVPRTCHAVREAVKSQWAATELKPTTKVSAEELRSFFLAACRDADASFLAGGGGSAALLPESLDPTDSASTVKKLLDEARDYLDSPQFLEVFRAVVAAALERFVASLGEAPQATGEPAPAPALPSDASVHLAKLGPACVTRSQAMFAPGDGGGFVKGFGQEPLVNTLCEALYFDTAKP